MQIMFIILLNGIATLALAFIYGGVCSLATSLRRRPHLQRIEGTILAVEKTRQMRSDITSKGRYGSSVMVNFFPVIHFTTPHGRTVRFRSERGESYRVRKQLDGTLIEPRSRYCDGQNIEVFYDSTGELKPCIASWWGLYFTGTGLLAGGLVLIGLSATLWSNFSARVFA